MSGLRLGRRRGVAVLVALVLVLVGCVVLLRAGVDASDAGRSPSGSTSPTDEGPVVPLPPRTTAVAPPTPGTIEQTEAPGRPGPTVPAHLDEPADLSGAVRVSLASITATKVEAVGPGDPSGPALSVRVRLDNESTANVNVDGAQVSLLYKRGREIAIPTPGGGSPFAGNLDAQKSAEGTYVFALPDTSQNNVTVLVTYAAGAPVAKFDGAVR